MKVYYSKGKHVILYYQAHELKQALGVLKALAQYFGASFLHDVARELERDMQQLQLPFDPSYRLCEACKCEIDIRKGNYKHIDGRFTHLRCPVLKPKEQRGHS